jgi:hypothetical protein
MTTDRMFNYSKGGVDAHQCPSMALILHGQPAQQSRAVSTLSSTPMRTTNYMIVVDHMGKLLGRCLWPALPHCDVGGLKRQCDVQNSPEEEEELKKMEEEVRKENQWAFE